MKNDDNNTALKPVNEDRTKPNPNWVTAQDGDCIGSGFDERGWFTETYDAKTRKAVRTYVNPRSHSR